eukprot:CAMPEP_0178544600 /NCGR_PEP_ID=MMETSP0697-20121206/3204_1 /TAXON_ID=265572 /ORGANISM="Extubocellulus spinifer, Strain CCMP396" /LENGTH=55 /DNA_ID=CAMNT_0020177129 /DNA_START=99 /DNA_END=266 /DNA_ORIENTATION=+
MTSPPSSTVFNSSYLAYVELISVAMNPGEHVMDSNEGFWRAMMPQYDPMHALLKP